LLYLDDLFMTLLFETHNNGHDCSYPILAYDRHHISFCFRGQHALLYLDQLFEAFLFETHNNAHVGLFAMDMIAAVQI
jgi:hypothetical protein